MGKFRDFFISERTPRWQILALVVLPFVAQFIENSYFQSKVWANNKRVEAQQRVHDKLIEIQKQSIEFQTYAGAFVSAILDGSKDVSQRKEQLVSNILAQDAAVDVSYPLFGKGARAEAEKYRTALRNMKDAVDQVTDVVSMSRFWKAASDLLVARNSLLDAIQKQSNGSGS